MKIQINHNQELLENMNKTCVASSDQIHKKNPVIVLEPNLGRTLIFSSSRDLSSAWMAQNVKLK